MRQTVYWGIIWRLDETIDGGVVLDDWRSGARRLRWRTYSSRSRDIPARLRGDCPRQLGRAARNGARDRGAGLGRRSDGAGQSAPAFPRIALSTAHQRSEERRVGKELRT